MKKIPTKIIIEGEERNNSFHLVLDFDDNFIPYLKDHETNYRFDISILFLKEILKNRQTRLFNKWYSLVFENNQIVDLVEEGSEEAKKIIKNSLLKIKDIPQGTMIKTYSGLDLIYLTKLYLTRVNSFLNLINIFHAKYYRSNNADKYSISFDKKNLFSKFNKYNLFLVPNTLKLILVKDEDINYKIEEIYDVVSEFSELNYNYNSLFLDFGLIKLDECIERTIISEYPFNKYHHLFNKKIMINSSIELNYLEKKCQEEIDKIINKNKEKHYYKPSETEDLPF